MAKTIWNEPIDKGIDWGGDENTGGLPVSGAMVQKFIKDALDGKAGLFYYDTANNRYIVFSDAANRDLYLEDPTRVDLIIGTFDAPFNYTAEINLATPAYNAVYLGDAGNYLDFTFDVKNKQGASTGENVVITYTFIRNASKEAHSQVARHGESIHFNVDKYLREGSNTIIIGVTGQTSLAATTVSVTYNVVNLQLTDETDISIVYDLSSEPKVMEVPFTIKGTGTKIIEWYLDGEFIEFVKNEDEVVDVEAQRVKYIQLANLQQGKHSLQIRAYTTINGERFYTQTLYRDIMIYTGANSNSIMAISMEIPAKYGLVENTPIIYGITQYIPYPLKFATYSPGNKTINVTVSVDTENVGSVNSQNGIVNEFSIVSNTSGNKTIYLAGDEFSYEIPAVVAKTTMSIEEITSSLKIDFSAIGKNNNSSDKDLWQQGDYVGTFEGFEWNAGSGWANNRLKINAGASFGINYAPLADNPKSLGRTLEFEFKTLNVNDDNAVICDLRNSSGTGILITATKVSVTSENGVVVENEFKSNENVRISIVINRATGTTRKGLTLIYANGSISRGINWAADDNYTSDTNILFKGSAGAEVELKSIRIYESALSDDNILNNYILYRDSVAEMLEVYDRNDVYAEGTTTFSPDKMVSRLPVMIVTGDIPTLENTSDKDTQIIVDIEYTNMQDTSRSFKMVGAAMRPQGTSSMGYPKKNFRIYTQKVANTILYDSNGNIVSDKLYSFKEGAIPVDCWCLKADYAESSGTHNTGIARMWNDALYNIQINDEYVCRTDAQKAALAAGYPYDVRTTIDGFPILLFYKKRATDEPIFIGKYNFNNDKSTEKVFGFTGIPGFDNSRMQCWEVLNNGNSIGLFTDISNFYNDVTSEGKTKKGWEFAFESRYPDTKSPNTDDLYNFAVWMNGVNGNHERFATEKWEHFKIYPMAAYYCYLMRHAAADQFVKNAMFTSEDGQKFYYILYDNDTINGLINTGDIDILPTDDRDSKNESGEYKFAGHSSVLWNMLEADSEFMQIVKDVDNALYSAGISYKDCVKVFDEEQADKWVERVYNQDSEYKYIGPYVNKGINNLEMLQGKRDLHRRWWLSKRFSIYDAKFVSGEYKSNAVELKCMNDTPKGQRFSIKSGYPIDYGFGINDLPRESGVYLAAGESHTFEIAEDVFRGDPIRIYAAPNIAELDLSSMANRLAEVKIAGVYTEELGTRLKKLILGGEGVNNVEVSEISGLKQAKMLTHLDVRGMKGIKALDLTSQPYFEELKAIGSEVASVSFAKGAPVNRLELPATMKILNLEQLPYLTYNNIVSEDNFITLKKIEVKGCPKISNSFDWIYNWYSSKTYGDEECSVIMDNVDWKGVNADKLVALTNLGTLNLKGKVTLEGITIEQLNTLMDVFGESAFDKNADFFINAPDAIFVTGRTELLEGESEDYNCVVFGGEVQKLTWSITSGSSTYTSLDTETGALTTAEGAGNRTLVIRTTALTDSGTKYVETTVKIKARTYPDKYSTKLSGNTRLSFEGENNYSLIFSTETNGNIDYEWELSGLAGYAELIDNSNVTCHVKVTSIPSTLVNGTLSCKVIRRYDKYTLFTLSMALELINDTIAETDAGVMTALYNAGLCSRLTYITKEEAARILDSDLNPTNNSSGSIFKSNNNIKSFEGFKWFTGLTSVPAYCFYRCTNMKSITLPEQITLIGRYAFEYCSALTSVNYGDLVEEISQGAFRNCSQLKDFTFKEGLRKIAGFNSTGLTSIVLPSTIEEVYSQCFRDCPSLITADLSQISVTELDETFSYSNVETVLLPDTVSTLFRTFENCKNLRSVNVPTNLKKLQGSVFRSTSITSFVLPEGLTFIGGDAFRDCTQLSDIGTIPESVEAVGEWAFYNSAVDLGEVTLYLPNLTGVGSSACFAGLGGRISIDVGINNNNYISEDGVLYTKRGSELHCYAKDRLNPNPVFTKEGLERVYLQGCKYLKSVTVPDSVWTGSFEHCESLEIINFNFKGRQITNNMFKGCTSLKTIDLTGVTYMFDRAFDGCTSLTFLTIPETVTSIEEYVFNGCVNLSSIYFKSMHAPSIHEYTFGTNQGSVAGWNTRESGNKLIIPMGATGYDGDRWQYVLLNPSRSNFTIYPDYEVTECTSLIITADDVTGRATKTNIRYTAITNGYNTITGEQITGRTLTGTTISESFPQNTSTTESLEIDISFTYMGVTATTTITQGVWIEHGYSVNLNNQWQKSSTIVNPDSAVYDGVYESFSNKGLGNTAAIMYIDIYECETFKFYVRSYAESGSDYVVVSNLDSTLTNDTTSGASVKMNTQNKQTGGIAISDYTLVEFTGIGGGEHFITVMYHKDSSANRNDDRGYVLIPKEQ